MQGKICLIYLLCGICTPLVINCNDGKELRMLENHVSLLEGMIIQSRFKSLSVPVVVRLSQK